MSIYGYSLIIVFLRFGEFLTGGAHFPLTADALKKVLTGKASKEILLSTVHALLGWMVLAPFILGLLYVVLVPCFKQITWQCPVPTPVVTDRNKHFLKCIQECLELLQLFGMPILQASGEPEGLCAQLNKQGRVDTCITSDSDAFLFGAKCIIKCLKPNSQEPFECYHMADIEAGLRLKRNHLIAITLLVGKDYDLKGVQGIGLKTTFSFVKCFNEDEV